jgi:hypothetical protein
MAGKTPCGARQNRRRTAGPPLLRRNLEPISGYRRTTLRESVAGIRRDPDEINDRPVRRGGRTEFGLPPSNYEGRFGNGAPFALHLSLRRFLDLIDSFFDFLNRRVQFFENFVLFPGKFFDAVGLLMQFLQHGILALRNAMHPPKANRPASDIQKGDKIYEVAPHRIRIVPRDAIGSAVVKLVALYGLREHREYR